jgi:alpha-ketoglutarate-dependent taurine dioxygenase
VGVTRSGGVPLLDIAPAQAAELSDSLAPLDVDDGALREPAYQEAILASVREAAGAAFDDLSCQANERLGEPPWFLILRGLPVERATPILTAVSATLGVLVEPYRQRWSQVVRHIVPSRDRAVDGRVLNELLHTDGTDWTRPNDYTCLFCVQADQSQDGDSRLLDIVTLLDEVTTAPNAEIIERLASQAVPWRIADELGGGLHWEPAIDFGGLHIRWLRYTIGLSNSNGAAPLSEAALADLLAFEQLIEKCRGVVETRLRAGDLLLIDNGRTLHARTPIRDPMGSVRKLRRTKVARKGVTL